MTGTGQAGWIEVVSGEAGRGTVAGVSPSTRAAVLERLRVLVVAGVAVGAVVAGAGSRLAMFVLRLTSPDTVRGVTSDDGFTIGRFTLGGTYSLLALGATVGFIGAGAYRAVAPWLLGPKWFRRVTVGAASGAVVGSMLVHADGIDFTLLKPTWLAVGLFVALPAVFAVAVSVAVDSVAAADSWTNRGRRRWLLPVVLVAAFPVVVFVVLPAALVLGAWVLARGTDRREIVVARPVRLAVRAAWLTVALLGLMALIGDVRALA